MTLLDAIFSGSHVLSNALLKQEVSMDARESLDLLLTTEQARVECVFFFGLLCELVELIYNLDVTAIIMFIKVGH